jgi:hypothetical protein
VLSSFKLMMRSLLLLLLLLASAGALAAEAPAAPPPAPPVEVLSPVDATARLVAGLPGLPDGPYATLEASEVWKTHRSDLDTAWATLEARRLAPTRDWAKEELWPRIDGKRPLLYFFGGPDAISPDVLYPDAPTLVLMGLERPGEFPQLERLGPSDLDPTLQSLRRTIRTTVDMSFFITSKMGGDMLRSRFHGVLPVLLLFLARNGEHPLDVTAVTLSKEGQVVELKTPPPEPQVGGWRIRYRKSAEAPVRELLYLRMDLGDEVVAQTPGLFRYLDTLGAPNAYLKAASFILHDRHFSKVKGYLLTRAQSVLQDDSGLPFKSLATPQWSLSYYGKYSAPSGFFHDHYQPEMAKAWKEGAPKPLAFETGYKHELGSHLLLALKVATDGGTP